METQFPLDSQQQPETKKVNVLSPHPRPCFAFFKKRAPFSRGCQEGVGGPAINLQELAGRTCSPALARPHRSSLMSTSAAAANGGATGVKGKRGRRLSAQGA